MFLGTCPPGEPALKLHAWCKPHSSYDITAFRVTATHPFAAHVTSEFMLLSINKSWDKEHAEHQRAGECCKCINDSNLTVPVYGVPTEEVALALLCEKMAMTHSLPTGCHGSEQQWSVVHMTLRCSDGHGQQDGSRKEGHLCMLVCHQ